MAQVRCLEAEELNGLPKNLIQWTSLDINMERTFVFQYQGDREDKIEELRKFGQDYRMSFEGDYEKGIFYGGPRILGMDFYFEGRYKVRDREVTLQVLEKPPLVKWEWLEAEMRRFIEG